MGIFRSFLAMVLIAAGLAGCSEEPEGPALPHPDPATFESGDLLWPALPGAPIPYFTREANGADAESERAAWEAEKRRFIESARASGDPEQQALADELEPLTFEEFRARYFQAEDPQSRELAPRAVGLPQVGHVAIVEVDASGNRWVVEAIPKGETRYDALYSRFPDGVVRMTYADWAEIHKDYNVSHGRVKDRPAAERAAIVTEAKQFLGRDYWFWSFDLSDEEAFYCSKLVWLSAWKAMGLALDGNPDFKRRFWVSPKQLINAPTIDVLYRAGDEYGDGS